MKNSKKIKLALNKKTIASLDNEDLKSVKGGEEQFLSIFNCSKTPSCLDHCSPSFGCDIVIKTNL